MATAGPGAIHLLSGVYDARMDGAPLIAITGLSYHDTIGSHPIQDVESDKLVEHACIYNERIMGPAHATMVADLAIRSALAHRGPSHIGISIDVQSQSEDTASPKNVSGHHSLVAQPTVSLPPQDQLERAADVLAGCERIAICAGAGARAAGDALEQVAELPVAPIIKAGPRSWTRGRVPGRSLPVCSCGVSRPAPGSRISITLAAASAPPAAVNPAPTRRAIGHGHRFADLCH